MIATAFAVLVAVYVLLYLLINARIKFLGSDRFGLAAARKIARTDGERSQVGPFTIWYSGTEDPSDLLRKESETALARIRAFIGEPGPEEKPRQLLVFHRRDDFVDYIKAQPSDFYLFDGAAAPQGGLISTEMVPWRLGEPADEIRFIVTHLDVIARFPKLEVPWVTNGLNGLITATPRDSDVLNRKMLVSIERRSELGVELFSMTPRSLSQFYRRWYEYTDFARGEQVIAQTRSVVEYLAGPAAPEERRDHFRQLLHEARKIRNQEALFRRLFGMDFEGLLRDWRGSVRSRGTGVRVPPSQAVEDALRSRVIPLAADASARFRDRLRAVRNLGRHGYVLGSETLIDLLDDPGEIPREEIVWSLECISGEPHGGDRRAWREWRDRVPTAG
ncbi:hypothetical protein [Aquisphaera insulae]|uniref:hypothetical protein n=1 Tax=Aquisphaera insulae TaxID=2712864 RepID=UPI0013EBCEF1|nr:hypothetical protein [Aquisphaera insulae]